MDHTHLQVATDLVRASLVSQRHALHTELRAERGRGRAALLERRTTHLSHEGRVHTARPHAHIQTPRRLHLYLLTYSLTYLAYLLVADLPARCGW